ncbi:hypothetical protein ACWEL8_05050 [Streptomyces sp. NPDC004690]|uniref:hypothetical protein n=1 Tax=Streptomyces sp. NPDC085995 TaxID=3154861 RepID=UPI00343707B8
MPTKTSRDRERPQMPHSYVDLHIGGTRLTAPKRTARRVARTVKRTVSSFGMVITGSIATELAHVISQR